METSNLSQMFELSLYNLMLELRFGSDPLLVLNGNNMMTNACAKIKNKATIIEFYEAEFYLFGTSYSHPQILASPSVFPFASFLWASKVNVTEEFNFFSYP